MGCISFSRDVPDPGIELESPALQADSLPSELPGKPHFGTSYKEGRMPLIVEYKASKSWQTLKSIQGLLLLSRFNGVRLCATPQTQHTRLRRPWDSPGKNTGVGCHFLLQSMKVKSESEVAQSCPTLRNPTDCSLSGSSVLWIFQARVLE